MSGPTRAELQQGQRYLELHPNLDRADIVQRWERGDRMEVVAASLKVSRTMMRCVLLALGVHTGRRAIKRKRHSDAAAYVGPEYEWARINKPLITRALQAFAP